MVVNPTKPDSESPSISPSRDLPAPGSARDRLHSWAGLGFTAVGPTQGIGACRPADGSRSCVPQPKGEPERRSPGPGAGGEGRRLVTGCSAHLVRKPIAIARSDGWHERYARLQPRHRKADMRTRPIGGGSRSVYSYPLLASTRSPGGQASAVDRGCARERRPAARAGEIADRRSGLAAHPEPVATGPAR